MREPDGFALPKRPTVMTAPPIPKFASGFGDTRKAKLTPKDAPLRVPPPPVAHTAIPSEAGHSKPLTHHPLPIPIPPPPLQPQAGPSKIPLKGKPLRVLKPPSFPILAGPSTKFSLNINSSKASPQKGMSPTHVQKPVMSIAQLQPKIAEALINPEPTKAKRSLTELQPPPPPPPRVGPQIRPGRKVTTISSTRVALTLDPTTESGMEELMALHMEQNPSTYVSPAQRELNRGLGQSPEKATKKKKAKFLRHVPLLVIVSIAADLILGVGLLNVPNMPSRSIPLVLRSGSKICSTTSSTTLAQAFPMSFPFASWMSSMSPLC